MEKIDTDCERCTYKLLIKQFRLNFLRWASPVSSTTFVILPVKILVEQKAAQLFQLCNNISLLISQDSAIKSKQ